MIYCVIENGFEQEKQSDNVGVRRNSELSGEQTRKVVFQNYIVILDIYDSYTDKLDLFERIASASPSPVRFILFNLPGQPYTQYPPQRKLNNAYYAECLDLLLYHLHEKHLISCLFEPYNLVGFGNGANIALYSAMLVNDTNDNLRSLLLFNGYSYVDHMLKDAVTTAIHSFRPLNDEEGDFFFHNLIYSTKNLEGKAWHSRDKVQLCKGVLSNISIKEKLKYLKMPIIYVYSKRNCLVALKHADVIKRSCGITAGEETDTSIYSSGGTGSLSQCNPMEPILEQSIPRTVIMIEGAHDVFTENGGMVERILRDYTKIKAPMKFFMMTSHKQSVQSVVGTDNN